jgi:hypothetical protein
MSHCYNFTTLLDIPTIAGFYSQLAGILSGFAFTALMFLAATRVNASNQKAAFSNTIRILFTAFICLVLTTLGYAVLAGQSGTDGRTASDSPILGVGFIVSGVLVVYAIVLTLDATSEVSHEVAASTRHLLAGGIAPLVVGYIYLGVQEYEDVRYGTCHGVEPLDMLGLSLIVIQLLAGWGVYPVLVRKDIRTKSPETVTAYAKWLSRMMLTVTFASAVAFSAIDADYPASKTLPPAAMATCSVVVSLVMLILTWQLAYTSPPRRAAAPNR